MSSKETHQDEALWYHSGKEHLERRNLLPGLHVGTYEQALMRGGRAITAIELDREIFARVKDDVTSPHVKRLLMAAHSQGVVAMRYLNRVEGISLEEFDKACKQLKQRSKSHRCPLDDISDSQFRRLVPSARDSLVILNPAIIVSLRPVERQRKAA